jgi:Domain of unknown function (DUF2017)
LFERRHFQRRGDEIRLRLDVHERLLLSDLLDELERLLDDPDDPELRRLFPPAYSDHADDEEQYRSLVRDQLVSGRSKALATVRETLAAERLDLDQADQWLRALNDVRLVLGTRWDVTEQLDYGKLDLDSPRGRELAVYGYLSWLQEQLVEALTMLPGG